MAHIDELLAALAHAPGPPALAALDSQVLARLETAPRAAGGRLALPAVLMAAATIGLIGGMPQKSAPPLSPLVASAALSPAGLLAGLE